MDDYRFDHEIDVGGVVSIVPAAVDVALPAVPKFYCAGACRLDEETNKKLCDYKAAKRWYGYCPKCRNPFACVPVRKGKNETHRVSLGEATMSQHKDMVYLPTGIPEFDRVIGGGVVLTKLLMLGATKGSGKTTLLLQACDRFAQGGRKSYFASAEMTREAVIDYAKRLGIKNDNIFLFGDPAGIDVEDLFDDVLDTGAQLVVVDSLQTCTVRDSKADIGTVGMTDAVINMLSSFGQEKKRAIIGISHLTKGRDYGVSEKGMHLVDGLIRMEVPMLAPDVDERVRKIIGSLREIYIDGVPPKLRQGVATERALMEFTNTGLQTPSTTARLAWSKLVAR